MRIPSSIRGCRGVPLFILTIAMAISDCAGPVKNVPHKKQLLSKADSLFLIGNYEAAKENYSKICLLGRNSDETKAAQFYLAYIDVFYKNENSDWDKALKEFKTYATLYPRDRRTAEVLSWIRLLTVIKSFDTEFKRASQQVERLWLFKSESRMTKQVVLDSIAVVLRMSNEIRDSLVRKNRELENVIIDLEKKCQQAGK